MVMSRLNTSLEGYCFCLGKWYCDLDYVEMMRNGWIWDKFWRKTWKKIKPHDNRLDMEYERKNSQGWLMSLRSKQSSRWLIPSSEWRLGKKTTFVTTNTTLLPLPVLVREHRVSDLPNIQRLCVRNHGHFRTGSCLYLYLHFMIK